MRIPEAAVTSVKSEYLLLPEEAWDEMAEVYSALAATVAQSDVLLHFANELVNQLDDMMEASPARTWGEKYNAISDRLLDEATRRIRLEGAVVKKLHALWQKINAYIDKPLDFTEYPKRSAKKLRAFIQARIDRLESMESEATQRLKGFRSRLSRIKGRDLFTEDYLIEVEKGKFIPGNRLKLFDIEREDIPRPLAPTGAKDSGRARNLTGRSL